MRISILLFTTAFLALLGCNGEKQPTAAPPNTEANANKGPTPPVPPDAPDAPQPPAPVRPQPGQERSPEVDALLAEVTKLNGYENNYGKKEGDPLDLQFRSPGIKDADLAKLRPLLIKCPVPVGLGLGNCEDITDSGLEQLKDIGTLRRLSFGKKITNAGLKHLAGLTALEELYISSDLVTNDGLAHLAKLTNLKSLSIYGKGATDAGYAHLAGLVNLEKLHVGDLSHYPGDECLKHMAKMTKFKELSIGRDNLTDAGMEYVKNFTELRDLRIDSSKVTAKGVAYLAPLKKLQKLTVLSAPGFSGEGLAALAGMTELRELELIYTPSIDKVGSKHVGKLTGLKKLRFGTVQKGGLEGIAGLTALENLDLNYSRVSDEDMKYLSGLTSLQRLDVQHSEVTDEGLKHLAGLPKLKSLSAAANKITDAGLVHIASIPNLETLGLTECKITGSGLKAFAKHAKLKDLWINGNPITDAHVMALKDIPNLREVFLTGTKVSDDVALELKKAKPKLRISDAAGDDVVLDKKPTVRPKGPPVEDITKVVPAFKLTAPEFHKEYEAGRNAAAEKYKGKVIELSGEVDGVGRNGGGSYVTLKVEKQLIGVMCVTVDEFPWAKVAKGQKIKIKGQWPEFSVSAALINCVFVETGKYTAIPLTAAEMAKEYAADGDATVKKYDKKSVVLTGEVVDKEYNSAGAATVTLKTDNKIKVKAIFTAFEKDISKPIKVGQQLKVLGEFSLNFGNSDSVELYFCLPLP